MHETAMKNAQFYDGKQADKILNGRRQINGLTIDVEDYYQVNAFSKKIKFEDWPDYECRVERNTYKVLENLAEFGVCATFFILGWVAERYPKLVMDIASEGHEVACHGYSHELITSQTPTQFRSDVAKAKKILEDIIGNEVVGYRASTYSITKQTLWAFNILFEEGYKYDSSVFPIHHDVYGLPDAPRFAFIVHLNNEAGYSLSFQSAEKGQIFEFPISTIRFMGQNLPVSGGGYFRLFPYWFVRRALRFINDVENRPFLFYLHPWEFDPDQPRIDGIPLKSKLRHYLNLDKVENRTRKLLTHFRFAPVKDLLDYYGNTIAVQIPHFRLKTYCRRMYAI